MKRVDGGEGVKKFVIFSRCKNISRDFVNLENQQKWKNSQAATSHETYSSRRVDFNSCRCILGEERE